MAEIWKAGEHWTGAENDAIVADYLDMLETVLTGARVNKAAHNRALQARIPRSHKSIEFKHGNISAVMLNLGFANIEGYLPRWNVQQALYERTASYCRKVWK